MPQRIPFTRTCFWSNWSQWARDPGPPSVLDYPPQKRGPIFQIFFWTKHIWNAPTYTFLRRHKLPTPHLALWPTEVHVVMRGKVCEKGCYFLGIQTPLVATCKNKVCISNICHYLHFWKHTDFQNKDIQSPKYSVVLHLDHCIPVWGGGGCLFFSPLCSSLITEPPYTPQMREPQTYLSLKHIENYPKACTCISYFNQPGRNFGQLFEKCPNTWSYLTDRPKLAKISARSIETPNMITEMGT